MHYLIYGTGAIGGYIGGLLAQHGQQVTFLVRPQRAETMRKTGLTISTSTEKFHIPTPQIVTGPSEAAPPDAILLTVKSQQTASAIQDIQTLEQTPAVVSFQNGVDNEPLLTEAFGYAKVIAGTVTTAVAVGAAGKIEVERERGIGLAGDHPVAKILAAELKQSGILIKRYASADAMKWSKLLTNLLGNATSAICDLPPAAIFASEIGTRLEVAALRETLKLMSHLKIPVVNLPGLPSALLAFAVRYLPRPLYRGLLRRSVTGGRGGKLPSLHIDLRAGHSDSEVVYLNGAVDRYAREAELCAPINCRLNEILSGIAKGSLPWERFRGRPTEIENYEGECRC